MNLQDRVQEVDAAEKVANPPWIAFYGESLEDIKFPC